MRPFATPAILATVLACSGPAGPIGPAGDRGEPGLPGEGGRPGSDGDDGRNGKDGENGKSALLRFVSEPAGEHCALGGTRIDQGLDLDDSGTLEDEEVLGSTYACHYTPPAGSCTTLHGDLVIRNELELQSFAAAGCTKVTGNVLVDDVPVTGLGALAGLEEIGGRLSITKTKVTAVLLPVLERVGGGIYISENTNAEVLDLSSLVASGGESFSILKNVKLVAIDLRSLETSNWLSVANNGAVTLLDLRALRTVGRRLDIISERSLEELLLPALEEVTSEAYIANNSKLAMLSAPKFTKADSVQVRNNPALPQCQVTALKAQFSSETSFWSSDNNNAGVCP